MSFGAWIIKMRTKMHGIHERLQPWSSIDWRNLKLERKKNELAKFLNEEEGGSSVDSAHMEKVNQFLEMYPALRLEGEDMDESSQDPALKQAIRDSNELLWNWPALISWWHEKRYLPTLKEARLMAFVAVKRGLERAGMQLEHHGAGGNVGGVIEEEEGGEGGGIGHVLKGGGGGRYVRCRTSVGRRGGWEYGRSDRSTKGGV
jgi:hypothetical protein